MRLDRTPMPRLALIAGLAAAVLGCSSGGSPAGGDTTAPSPIATSPASGATGVSPGATVSVSFSEAMDPATVTAATFQVRGPGGLPVAGSVACAGATATFTPAAPLAWLATYTATLGTGARDLAGNALVTPVGWSFTTAAAPDVTPPTVVSRLPAPGATGVATGALVVVTFSEPVDAGSAAATSLTGPGGAVPATVATVGAVATLTPLLTLAELTTYTVRIPSTVRDLAGNLLGAEDTWTFTTLTSDLTAPTVTSVTPAAGASGVDVGTGVSILFSESVAPATVTATTLQLQGPGTAPVAGTITFGGKAASFVPAAPLVPATTYTVVATAGITDLVGNPLTPFSASFTTLGPGGGSWVAMAPFTALDPYSARVSPGAVWTGNELIVWGGWTPAPGGALYLLASGGRYTPASDSWTAFQSNLPNNPTGRFGHAAVWAGNQLIVWGGRGGGGTLSSGGRYDPAVGPSGAWTSTSTINAPVPRSDPGAVWTGNQLVVWGGWEPISGVAEGTGGRYSPASDTWSATSLTGAPSARVFAATVWTGSRMIVWGGSGFTDGALYDPVADSWTPMAAGGPTDLSRIAAVWTGSRMIVWGLSGTAWPLGEGAAYDPATDSWSPINLVGEPPAGDRPAAAWTGSRMILWGGDLGGIVTQTGGLYDPLADAWSLTALAGAPTPRGGPAAVWTGTELIIWGGLDRHGAALQDGARYTP